MWRNAIHRLLLLTASALLFGAIGCAQQVGDIDRTQANALLKADFLDGEWYIRQTFTDVPPAAYAGFVGLTGDLEKIVWEITEDYLIAYRSYENNPGSRSSARVDANGDYSYVDGWQEGYSDEFKESPIAAYPIVSHFDIQRGYSASTGEQTNVISENGSDRLWYEREHFRVDWSNVLETQVLFDGYFRVGVDWYVQSNEGSNDSFRMEYFDSARVTAPGVASDAYDNGDLYYMDFTNRLLLDPGYSYCFGRWYPQALDDCASSEVELRTSILRVPNYTEYEPIVYDDIDQQKFGYFRNERLVYDRERGTMLSNQILLASRHNIWSNTWQRDDDGDIRRDSEGRMVPNPFAERTAEPIVYHVSFNYPESLWDATVGVGEGWNRAFQRAVAAAQDVNIESVREMFIVCHNPVLAEDDEACGAEGVLARVGDLRYNFIYWVDNPQASGPLGYGPSSPDPETGELITGTAFVYGAAVDRYSTYALDLVRFFNGDLDIDGLRDADYIRDELMVRADPNVDPRARINADLGEYRIEDIEIRDMLSESNLDFLAYVDEFGINDFVDRPLDRQRRFDLIADSGAGALAVDDEVVRGFGVESFDDFPEEIRDEFFRGGAMMPALIEASQRRIIEAAEQNIMLPDHLDDTIVGLARTFSGRTDYEQIRLELRAAIYQGVMEHEVGHTVGLRHNFQGSYDSINYFDEYWALKTDGVLGTTNEGDVDVIPFRRPVTLADIYGMAEMTPAQVEGRMREYQYSSIMDYSSGFNTDIHGIGRYDEAAIIYAYTTGRDDTVGPNYDGTNGPISEYYNVQQRGYVETFDNVGDARPIFYDYEGLDSPGYTDLLETYHYSSVASAMGHDTGAETIGDSLDSANNEADPAMIRSRLSSRTLLRFEDVLNQREAEIADRPIEVPYLFLSDYWRGARQSARPWDQGADPLEQAQNMIQRYRTYYPFTYFRRDRLNWSQYDIVNRLASRYFRDLLDNYQRWLFGVAFGGGTDDALDTGWTFGAYASLNVMSEVLTTPSYGSFNLDEDDNTYYLSSYGEQASADLYISPGEGRRPYSRYDVGLGYNYWNYPVEAGHFWAYYAAIIVMAGTTSLEVRGADVGADFLSYSIPVYLVFEDEMTTLFNSLWLSDNSAIAPNVIEAGDGKLVLERRLFAPINLTSGAIMDAETGFITEAVMDNSVSRESVATIDVIGGFTYQYLPFMYGMAFFDSNFNMHFHDQNKIFRIDSGEVVAPGEGFELVQFCDPFSYGGECYGALYETGTDDPPASVRLIRSTEAAYEDFLDGNTRAQFAVENYIERMNMMRGFYEIFGNVW
jgi:hypothetical protein